MPRTPTVILNASRCCPRAPTTSTTSAPLCRPCAAGRPGRVLLRRTGQARTAGRTARQRTEPAHHRAGARCARADRAADAVPGAQFDCARGIRRCATTARRCASPSRPIRWRRPMRSMSTRCRTSTRSVISSSASRSMSSSRFRASPRTSSPTTQASAPPRRADGGYHKYGRAPLSRPGVRIGLHAKSMVIDDEVTVIGSHNFDPRSDHYNTESGFIIFDRALAEAVRASILRDSEADNAWIIAKRPRTPAQPDQRRGCRLFGGAAGVRLLAVPLRRQLRTQSGLQAAAARRPPFTPATRMSAISPRSACRRRRSTPASSRRSAPGCCRSCESFAAQFCPARRARRPFRN